MADRALPGRVGYVDQARRSRCGCSRRPAREARGHGSAREGARRAALSSARVFWGCIRRVGLIADSDRREFHLVSTRQVRMAATCASSTSRQRNIGSRTVRPFRLCRTVRSRLRLPFSSVHRSPFSTQSVAVIRRVRLLARVITCSPSEAPRIVRQPSES